MASCLIKVVLILAVIQIFEVNAANETLVQPSTTSAPPTTPSVCGVRYGFSAHPTLCNTYLICSDYNVMSQVTCPSGTLFDVTTSRCLQADRVKCGKASIPETTASSSTPTSKASSASTSTTPTSSKASSASISTTPTSSKTSSASISTTPTSSKASSASISTTPTSSKASSASISTTPTSSKTSSASTAALATASTVSSKTPATSPTTTSASPQSASTKSTSTVLTQTPSSASSTPEPTSAPSTKSAFQPRCDIKDGLTQNPLKCNSFIICSNFAVISDVRCPLGTLFDVKTKMCQRSELVVCGTRL